MKPKICPQNQLCSRGIAQLELERHTPPHCHLRQTATSAHSITNCTILLFLALKGGVEFSRDWDYLSYHLPDALGRFGLTTYQPAPHLQVVNEAFPPLPHILQGLLIWLTGRMSAGNSLNALGFILVAILLFLQLRTSVSWRWFFTAVLSVPLVVFHLPSGYIDFFSNLWPLLCFGSLLRMLTDKAGKHPPSLLAEWCLLLGVGIGMLSKLQMWPIMALICGYSAGLILLWVKQGVYSRARGSCLILCLALLFAIWPVRNLIRYGNPTYPAEFPFLSKVFPNHAMPAATPWNIPEYLLHKPKSLAFFQSVLELNRIQEPSTFRWSIDQWSRETESSPHQRMGGWFYGTMLVLVATYALAFYQNLAPRSLLALLGLSVVMTSAIPQSHELRYWLYVPFSLSLFFAYSIPQLPAASRKLLCSTLLICFAFVLSQTLTLSIDSRLPEALAPLEAKDFWNNAKPQDPVIIICDKMPNTIFWSGPTFSQFNVEGCENE